MAWLGFIARRRGGTRLPSDRVQGADAWLDPLGVPHNTRPHAGAHAVSQAMQDDLCDWVETVVRA